MEDGGEFNNVFFGDKSVAIGVIPCEKGGEGGRQGEDDEDGGGGRREGKERKEKKERKERARKDRREVSSMNLSSMVHIPILVRNLYCTPVLPLHSFPQHVFSSIFSLLFHVHVEAHL